MANNVGFQSSSPSTPSSATIVETLDQGGGVQRQVVSIGSGTVAVSSGTVTPSSATTVTPSSNVTVAIFGVPSVTVSSGTITPSSNVTVSVGIPLTSGGYTVASAILSTGTNGTNIKSSPGQVYKIEVFNNSATIAYLKMYNLSSVPTAGTTAASPVHRLLIPANTSGTGATLTYPSGDAYSTGIGYTVTGGILDTDTTALASNAYIVNVHYT